MKSETAFDQPVILEQPAVWSRVVVWLLVAMTNLWFSLGGYCQN
jgi:hypothetical protein